MKICKLFCCTKMASRWKTASLWTLVSVNSLTLVLGGLITWLGYAIPVRLKRLGLAPQLAQVAGVASLLVASLGLCALNYSSHYALNVYGLLCAIFALLMLCGTIPDEWSREQHDAAMTAEQHRMSQVIKSAQQSGQNSSLLLEQQQQQQHHHHQQQQQQQQNNSSGSNGEPGSAHRAGTGGLLLDLIYFFLLALLAVLLASALAMAQYLRRKEAEQRYEEGDTSDAENNEQLDIDIVNDEAWRCALGGGGGGAASAAPVCTCAFSAATLAAVGPGQPSSCSLLCSQQQQRPRLVSPQLEASNEQYQALDNLSMRCSRPTHSSSSAVLLAPANNCALCPSPSSCICDEQVAPEEATAAAAASQLEWTGARLRAQLVYHNDNNNNNNNNNNNDNDDDDDDDDDAEQSSSAMDNGRRAKSALTNLRRRRATQGSCLPTRELPALKQHPQEHSHHHHQQLQRRTRIKSYFGDVDEHWRAETQPLVHSGFYQTDRACRTSESAVQTRDTDLTEQDNNDKCRELALRVDGQQEHESTIQALHGTRMHATINEQQHEPLKGSLPGRHLEPEFNTATGGVAKYAPNICITKAATGAGSATRPRSESLAACRCHLLSGRPILAQDVRQPKVAADAAAAAALDWPNDSTGTTVPFTSYQYYCTMPRLNLSSVYAIGSAPGSFHAGQQTQRQRARHKSSDSVIRFMYDNVASRCEMIDFDQESLINEPELLVDTNVHVLYQHQHHAIDALHQSK